MGARCDFASPPNNYNRNATRQNENKYNNDNNADTNSQWAELLGESPVQVSADEVVVGDRQIQGNDLTCLFVQPRKDSDVASVIAISATGIPGIRLSCKQSLFQPFVRYPDCAVLRVPNADSGRAIVEAAGYFGADWSVAKGEFLFK